jgi:soluble lytic murein transglycosylase-like protein
MKRLLLTMAAVLMLGAGAARAGDAIKRGLAIRDCIFAAATAYRLPPAVLLILLDVEGGSLGRVSPNSNGSVDIGPMQVNEIWMPQLEVHWKASRVATYAALRDDFCANVEGGAWILRQAIDEAHGDFWEGVGLYHSHDHANKADYLRRILRQALQLEAQAARDNGTATTLAAKD